MKGRNSPLLLLFFAVNLAVAQPQHASIVVPHDMAPVPWRACISGITSQPNQDLIAIVRPALWSDYFVEPLIKSGDDGRYEAVLYIGDNTPEIFEGQQFEVRLFLNTQKEKLREGMRLPAWPDDPVSPLIRVVRSDHAPSGCSGPVAAASADETGIPHFAPSTNTAGVVRGTTIYATPQSNGSFPGILGTIIISLYAMIVIVFVAMATVSGRVEAAANRLSGWIDPLRIWLVAVALKLTSSICCLWNWLVERVKRGSQPIWNAKGYQGNLRQFAVSVLVAPLLLLATIGAFYADARTNMTSLGLIFGVDESDLADNPGTSMLGSMTATGNEAVVQPSGQKVNGGPPGKISSEFATFLAHSFEALWTEKLGFWATSLAGLQGAFGIVLLWGIDTGKAALLRPIVLVKERPFVAGCFLTLNLALALLAGNRGYELSRGANWIAPAVISTCLSLAVPAIMSLSLHYSIECAADFLSIVEMASLIGGLGLIAFCILAGWVATSLVVVSGVGIAFIASVFSIAIAWLFLHSAILMGDFIRGLRPAAPAMPLGVSLRAVSALFVFTIIAGSGYFLFREVMR